MSIHTVITWTRSRWEVIRDWPYWRPLGRWLLIAVVLLVLALAALGARSLRTGSVNLDDLLPREKDRITGAAIVITAIATLALASATVMLFFSTRKLAKATALSIATDAPLIAFSLTLDESPMPVGRGHDPGYLEKFRLDDLREYVSRAGQPIQYVRLSLQNVQTKPYAAATNISVGLELEAARKSEAMTPLTSPIYREVPVTIVPAESAFETIAFNVGGLTEFTIEVFFLQYHDLHSDLDREAGFGLGWIQRARDGTITTDWRVSPPNEREVPR